jgi:LysR family glycine cleavage system transcriptional activator
MLKIGNKRITLKALQTFESAAEHLSMSRAADALSVTQSAVSHQVRKLEEELEVRLFIRAGRTLKLTVEGDRLFRSVRRTLSDLKHDVETFTEEHFDGVLTIAAPPTFTTLWLLPRLPEFRERFPQLRYRLKTMPVPPPASLPDADITVQFGTQYWPDKRVAPLVDTNYMPVCAPQMLQGRAQFVPEDLAAEVLIHDDSGEAWASWLAEVGLGGLVPGEEIFVENAIDALHMARMGIGFAINDQIIASNWVAQGDLIQPFSLSVDSYDQFYIVTDHEKDMKPAAQEFESWLRRGIAQFAQRS